LFIGYGLLFVWGLMIDGLISTNPFANAGNPMDLGRADTWLHLGVAALGLLIAVLPARRTILLPEDETVAEPAVAEQRTEVVDRDRVDDEPRRRSFLRRDHKGRGPEVTREERPPGLAH
jgi:hypothetical protein